MFTPKNRGRIWSIVLKDNDGVTEMIQAYGVPQVLLDTIGHGARKSYKEKFLKGCLTCFQKKNLICSSGTHTLASILSALLVASNARNLCCYDSRLSHTPHTILGHFRMSQTLSDILKPSQNLSDPLRLSQILSDILRQFQIISDPLRLYQTLSDILR